MQALFEVSMVTYYQCKPYLMHACFDISMVTYLRGEPYVMETLFELPELLFVGCGHQALCF